MTLEEALQRTREVATQVVAPLSDQTDAEGLWPERQLRALQAAGLGGLVAPRTVGGHGYGLAALAQVCELLAEHCPTTAICFGMHCVGTAVLSAKATPEQVDRYLGPICAGTHLTTLALSEPGTGAHFYVPEASLLPTGSGDGFVLNGVKSFVTNGGHADSYVVNAAATGPGAAVGEFSCAVVPAGAKGMAFSGKWTGWGMRGNSSVQVVFKDTPVRRGDLLGAGGDEIWYVFNVVTPYFLIAMSGTYVGIARAAVTEARAHLLSRRHTHTGSALSQNVLLQHRLGTLWSRAERTSAFVLSAAQKGDASVDDALAALCSAKAEVGELAEGVVAEAMTLMGGRAYAEGARIQRLYRDARAAHVMAPTTDMLRTWTGRALLGLPILGG